METDEFQEEYEESDAEAEAPGEHTPCPEGDSNVPDWCHQAEGDAGENQLQHSNNAHGHY